LRRELRKRERKREFSDWFLLLFSLLLWYVILILCSYFAYFPLLNFRLPVVLADNQTLSLRIVFLETYEVNSILLISSFIGDREGRYENGLTLQESALFGGLPLFGDPSKQESKTALSKLNVLLKIYSLGRGESFKTFVVTCVPALEIHNKNTN